MARLHPVRRDWILALGFAAAAAFGGWLGVILVPEATGAPTEAIDVPRTGAALPAADVEDLIFRELADRGYPGELMVRVPDLPEAWRYEEDETGFRLHSPSSDTRLGPVSFYLEFLSGSTARRIVPLTAWVRIYRQQVVTARPVSRGQTLAAGDVKLKRVEVLQVDDPGFDAVEDALGLRARRSLPAGWAVGNRDLERVPAILRGQRVPVRYSVGAITVRATVEAKSDGWVGDAIPVMNVESRRGFTARVTGPGTLIVEGGR